MVAPITQIGVDQSHIHFGETGFAEVIDTLSVIPMYLLIPRFTLKMLTFECFSGQPFQHLGDDIFLCFTVGQNKIGVYSTMGICDKFQPGR